jgi:hypothetical protein
MSQNSHNSRTSNSCGNPVRSSINLQVPVFKNALFHLSDFSKKAIHKLNFLSLLMFLEAQDINFLGRAAGYNTYLKHRKPDRLNLDVVLSVPLHHSVLMHIRMDSPSFSGTQEMTRYKPGCHRNTAEPPTFERLSCEAPARHEEGRTRCCLEYKLPVLLRSSQQQGVEGEVRYNLFRTFCSISSLLLVVSNAQSTEAHHHNEGFSCVYST